MPRIKIGGPGGGEFGKFIKWNEVPVGTTYTGTWKGARKGKFGDLGDLLTADGPITFPIPTKLASLLEEIALGDRIEIEYLGTAVSEKSERTYHDFNLFKLTPDDDVPF